MKTTKQEAMNMAIQEVLEKMRYDDIDVAVRTTAERIWQITGIEIDEYELSQKIIEKN